MCGGAVIPRAQRITKRYRSKRRDVMILMSHVRSGRDILVSGNSKDFGCQGSSLRQQLEDLCSTQIMTLDEFCKHCDQLRAEG